MPRIFARNDFRCRPGDDGLVTQPNVVGDDAQGGTVFIKSFAAQDLWEIIFRVGTKNDDPSHNVSRGTCLLGLLHGHVHAF